MKLHDVSKLFQQYQSIIYNLKLVNPLIYRQILSYREEGHVNDLLKKRKKEKEQKSEQVWSNFRWR